MADRRHLGIVVAFVTIELVVLDRSDPAHRSSRFAAARTAVAMGCGAVLIGVLYGAAFAALWRLTGRFAPRELVAFWDRRPLLEALCAFVAWDFSGWIYHLIGHRTTIGRAAHSPHHSGSHYDASLALRLTWMPWHGLLHHPLLALLGFRLEIILGCLAVSNLAQALAHSATLPPAPRWLGVLVMTPGAHRHHHGPDSAHRNLGPVLTIWDRMAGTWYPPWTTAAQPGTSPTPRDTPVSHRGALATELAGWQRLVNSWTARPGGPGPTHR